MNVLFQKTLSDAGIDKLKMTATPSSPTVADHYNMTETGNYGYATA